MPNAWIINPADSGTENPRRRRRRGRGGRFVRGSHKRRRRARRNPMFRAHRRRHARRGRRRAFRNPSMRRFFGLDLGKIAVGTGGAVGSDMLGDWAASMIPATLDPNARTLARYGAKVAAVVAVGMLVSRMFGRGAGAVAGLGGGVLLGVDAAREFVLPNLPMLPGGGGGPVKGYLYDEMKGYMSAPALSGWGKPWGTGA